MSNTLPTWAELKQTHSGAAAKINDIGAMIAEAKIDDGQVDAAEWGAIIVRASGVLADLVGELYAEAQEVMGATPGDRRAWGKRLLKDIYHDDLDVDIPWIVEPFESMAENAALGKMGDALFDLVEKLIARAASQSQVGAGGSPVVLRDEDAERDRAGALQHEIDTHPND